MTIRNPVEWTYDLLRPSALQLRGYYRPRAELNDAIPEPRQIAFSDLREALVKGFEDFGAYRTDVLFIGIILAFRQVIRLFREVRWVNDFRVSDPGLALRDPPVLLAPMASLLGNRLGRGGGDYDRSLALAIAM